MLPWKLKSESEKLKISGGELTRLALSAFIRCMSSIPVKLNVDDVIFIMFTFYFDYLLFDRMGVFRERGNIKISLLSSEWYALCHN